MVYIDEMAQQTKEDCWKYAKRVFRGLELEETKQARKVEGFDMFQQHSAKFDTSYFRLKKKNPGNRFLEKKSWKQTNEDCRNVASVSSGIEREQK